MDQKDLERARRAYRKAARDLETASVHAGRPGGYEALKRAQARYLETQRAFDALRDQLGDEEE